MLGHGEKNLSQYPSDGTPSCSSSTAISSLFLAKAVLGYGARYQAAHDMMTTTGF